MGRPKKSQNLATVERERDAAVFARERAEAEAARALAEMAADRDRLEHELRLARGDDPPPGTLDLPPSDDPPGHDEDPGDGPDEDEGPAHEPGRDRWDTPMVVRKILAAIKHRGFVQGAIDASCSLGRQKLSEWKRCASRDYTPDRILAIARKVDIDLVYLMDDAIPLAADPPRMPAPPEDHPLVRRVREYEMEPEAVMRYLHLVQVLSVLGVDPVAALRFLFGKGVGVIGLGGPAMPPAVPPANGPGTAPPWTVHGHEPRDIRKENGNKLA